MSRAPGQRTESSEPFCAHHRVDPAPGRGPGAVLADDDPPAPGIVMADGGGRAGAALRPIRGGTRIARYAVAIMGNVPDLTLVERSVNGQPGLVPEQTGRTVTVVAFTVGENGIERIWAVRNPEKLRRWSAEP